MLVEITDHRAILVRGEITDRIGDVQRRGTRLDRHGHCLAEKQRVAAPRVHRRKLNIGAERAGKADHLADDRQTLLAGLPKLVFEMNVRGGHKGVDALLRGGLDGRPCFLNILAVGTGQSRNRGAIGGANLAGNLVNRRPIAGGRRREACLNNVHLQAGQLAGDLQLLLQGQRTTGGLLTIAQGRIKDAYM